MAQMRKFYHRVAGAKFYLQGNAPGIIRELSFPGGLCETDDPQAIEELSKIANLPGSQVYTDDKEQVQDLGERLARTEVMDTAVSAFDNENKIPPGARTIPIPQAPQPQPVVPGSLQAKTEAARAAVAASQGRSTPSNVGIQGSDTSGITKK